jgi:hypothetical protein
MPEDRRYLYLAANARKFPILNVLSARAGVAANKINCVVAKSVRLSLPPVDGVGRVYLKFPSYDVSSAVNFILVVRNDSERS